MQPNKPAEYVVYGSHGERTFSSLPSATTGTSLNQDMRMESKDALGNERNNPPPIVAEKKVVSDFKSDRESQSTESPEIHNRLAFLVGHGSGPSSLGLLSPDIFLRCPESYLDELKSIQQQIYDSGKEYLGNIERVGKEYLLSMPHLQEPPPKTKHQTMARDMRKLLAVSLKLALQISDSLDSADSRRKDFIAGSYSIIVQDSQRPQVLRVVSVSRIPVNLLKDLSEEAFSCCTQLASENVFSPSTLSLVETVLDDLYSAVSVVLLQLNLDISSTRKEGMDIYEKGTETCGLLQSLLSVLFLGLVSFITSHISLGSDLLDGQSDELRIETVGGNIYMSRRRLLCLDGFLKQPVWCFSSKSVDSMILTNEQQERFYLSTTLKNFIQLWGPVRFGQRVSVDAVSHIRVRGGDLRAVNHPLMKDLLEDNETPCHWHSWLDNVHEEEETHSGINIHHHLLIGGRTLCEKRQTKTDPLDGIVNCSCDKFSTCIDNCPAFELKTRVPSWRLEEKVAQISGGQYITALYGHTWKFNAGWTMKDVIVEDWVESSSASHYPKSFYLDYYTVLEVSRCTSHVRRITIWNLLQQDIIRRYLEKTMPRTTMEDFAVLLTWLPSDSFSRIWDYLTDEGRGIFKSVVGELLNTLRSTGVGEDGLLQAWDTTAEGRLDGRKLKPCWRSMAKDDIACTTFAVITNVCIKHHHQLEGSSRQGSNKRRRETSPSAKLELHKEFVLWTKLRITTSPFNSGKKVSSHDNNAGLTDFYNRSQWRARPQWRAYGSQPLPAQANKRSKPEEQLEELRQRHIQRKKHTSYKLPIFDVEMTEVSNPGAASPVDCGSYNNQSAPQESRFDADSSMWNGCLEFKNGERVVVGKLLIEPHQKLRSLTNNVVHVKWEECRRGLLTAIREKEQAADNRIREWAQQKGSGFFPWMINHISSDEEEVPYAMECIRREDWTGNQTVVDSFIE